MIEFLTVFLGLVTGVHPLAFSVSPDTVSPDTVNPNIATLEIRLDGETLEVLTDKPWRLDCDFGDTLEPHELVAIARDGEGRELQRLVQWVNIDIPPADGTASTALLIRLDAESQLPPPEAMESWFRADGQPLVVERVEKGSAEVVILRDPAAPAFFEAMSDPIYEETYLLLRERLGADKIKPLDKELRLAWVDLDPTALAPRQVMAVERAQRELRAFATLGPETTLRFVSPFAAAPSRVDMDRRVFHRSSRHAAREGGMLWLTNTIPTVRSHFRLADALAVSARQLHGKAQRRALVVLLSQPWEDESLHPPARVRDYLARLQVPMVVWSLTVAEPHPDWGEVVDLRQQPRETRRQPLGRATDALRQRLESQRVIWLRGRHLPRSIELSDQVRGVCLVGRCADPEP